MLGIPINLFQNRRYPIRRDPIPEQVRHGAHENLGGLFDFAGLVQALGFERRNKRIEVPPVKVSWEPLGDLLRVAVRTSIRLLLRPPWPKATG